MRPTHHEIKSFLFLWTIFCALTSAATQTYAQILPEDASKAVILAYHRVGEDAYPDTNLTTQQFDQHIDILTNGPYTILPLTDIIAAWEAEESLPSNTVAITFDGAYRSSYDNAMQKLIDQKIPFTIFYSAESTPMQSKHSAHLDWKTIKALSRNKDITFGILPATYARHAEKSPEEIRAQINSAIAKHRAQLKEAPRLFSYPFGESSPAYQKAVADNFIAALSLNSGVAYNKADRFALPRFSMTERYADTERFLLVTQALPLPAKDIITTENALTFTTSDQLTAPPTCFVSGQSKPEITINDAKITITAPAPFTSRTRINCTIKQGKDRNAVWRWFGILISNQNDQ